MRVTLVLMSSAANRLTAFSPSSIIGTLMTILSLILASSRASATIPSASRLTTSALIGPSTRLQISSRMAVNGRCSLAMSEGLVVTPSTMPSASPFLISSMLAVSMKNFIALLFRIPR